MKVTQIKSPRRGPRLRLQSSAAAGPDFAPGTAADLRRIGNGIGQDVLQGTRALLSPAAAPVETIAYGDAERQRLDIVRPAGSGGRAPIAIFVPGGGFVGGSKDGYTHIPAWFAANGVVGVAIDYRLAPDASWPDGACDVAAAIDFVAANAEALGGDPDRIFVVAQSAGAAHAAGALFDRALQPKRLTAVRAAVLMSGLYAIEPDMQPASINTYFGNDADVSARSPIANAAPVDIPVALTVAELEPDIFEQHALGLCAILPRAVPTLLWNHNHYSTVVNFGSAEDRLAPAILAFFNRAG